MPRIEPELQRLQEIKSLPSLLKYLKDDLNWPIGSDDVEDVTFDYDPVELGFDSASTAKIEEVRQLRPLSSGQKWGIFWVKFGKKQLPVQMLRRALGNLVVKKRTTARSSERAAWHMHDLLFISAYGDDNNRHITFAHFSENEESAKALPVLKVLGWDEDDTLLHLKDTYKTLIETLDWDKTPTNDPVAWRDQWSSAFKFGHREVINTTKELVVELAQLATVIKKSVLTSIKAETEKGPWKRLMLAFQKTLIKDLDEDQFADVIAQTVSYGLLTARLSSDGPISLKNLVDMVPSTNPFLKELLQHFLTSAGMKGLFDVDEAGINDVVELLNRANAQAIRNDFGKKTDGEDPVIHFYEHFLGAYNKKLKVERGVFYTPQPAVSYIVRSIHELLQKEFGLEDGLADISTWADVQRKHKALKIPEDIKDPKIEPFVQILDPATGTATFLIEVIDVIHNTMVAKWNKERISKADQAKKWNTYVPTHLLPRLYAYELMMAPYAIAHMKVGLKLNETGFTAWEKLGPENRANIFLTNALEPWTAQLNLPGFNALAHEAAAVNEVKKHKRFTTIVGNPPYSNFGQLNKNDFIQGLLQNYKRGLDEKKINLDDDFIKFTCFAQHLVDKSGVGAVGMITNNVFLDGITHRRMREALIGSFNEIWILDLHGSSKKLEVSPDGSKDDNVFEIQQGVGITLFVKSPHETEKVVKHSELWGLRDKKYESLKNSNASECTWESLDCMAPHFFFVPKSFSGIEEYKEQPSISGEVFVERNAGIQTKRDGLAYSFTKKEMEVKINDLISCSKAELTSKYELPEDGRDWAVNWAKDDVKKSDGKIVRVAYHPFDLRWTYFTGRSKGLMAYPRTPLMWSLLQPNITLLTVRNPRRGNIDSFFACNMIVDKDAVSPFDNASFFPLYIYPNPANSQGTLDLNADQSLNLSPSFIRLLCDKLGLPPKGPHGLPDNMTPESVFNYVYAVLHSPNYRKRYAEFLKIDFPRLPLTSNLELFRSLAGLGSELTELHLLTSPKTEIPISEFIGPRSVEIEKVSWAKNTVWIDKAQETGFKGVNAAIWNFHIGGYQVCEKWLKARKSRKLTNDDVAHYQKIIAAISETIRLMVEIDKVIDEHGGWPGAFRAKP